MLAGRAESVSSLDIEDTSARRRFKRMYHRVMSGLERKGNVRLLTLTSSKEAPSDFQRSFRKLIMRLNRRGLVGDYIRVPEKTSNNQRHDHILFRGSYIDQAYLSYLWSQIHNSPVVDIRRTYGRRGLACYLANYLAKAPCGRYSYSFGWVWRGFAKSWKFLKKASRVTRQNYLELLTTWKRFVKLKVQPNSSLGIYWLTMKWGLSYAYSEEILSKM